MQMIGGFRTEALEGEERYARRHSLSLDAQAAAGGGVLPVQIINLSSTGLLLQVASELDVGEEIDVELPQAGTRRARIVWRGETYYGCEFSEPVSTAAVSAARLRSMPPASSPSDTAAEAVVIPFRQAREIKPGALTLRRKAAIIIGLAIACWLVILLPLLVL